MRSSINILLCLGIVAIASGCTGDTNVTTTDINQSIEGNIRGGATQSIEHLDRVNYVDITQNSEEIANITPEDLGAEVFRNVEVDLILDDTRSNNEISDDLVVAKKSAIQTFSYAFGAHKSVLSVNVFVSKLDYNEDGERVLKDLGSIYMNRIRVNLVNWDNFTHEDLKERNLNLRPEKPERDLDQIVRTENFDRDKQYEKVIKSYVSSLEGYEADTESAYELLSSDVRASRQYSDYSNSISLVKTDMRNQGLSFDFSGVETIDETYSTAEVEVTMEVDYSSGITTTPVSKVKLIFEDNSWKIDENWNPYENI